MSPRSLFLLAVVAPFAWGCASRPAINNAANTVPAFPVTPRDLESLPVDGYCEVEMFSDELSHSMQYTGRIVRVDGERLTLDEIQLTERSSHKVPVLGESQIPAVRRMFSTTGIGTELIDGEKMLLREQIAEVKLLDPRTSAWYASRRRTKAEPREEKAIAEDGRPKTAAADTETR